MTLPKPRRNPGVLIVDDEAIVRSVVVAILRRYRFAVWEAASGPEALSMLRRHQRKIDLVLVDVCMPGWDGPRTFSALRDIKPRLRGCFMSGDLGIHTERSLLDRGAAAVLAKPFPAATLARTLGELVGGDFVDPVPRPDSAQAARGN